MQQYLDLMRKIMDEGSDRMDRTQTGTRSLFGAQMRFDLQTGFPLLTTKRVHLKSVIHELLWFIQGETNIQPLVKKGVRIWNEWPYETYKASGAYQGETIEAFVTRLKEDDAFAKTWGDLGPVYGKQWRAFEGEKGAVDQLKDVVDALKKDRFSRRLLVSSWNPSEIDAMALPPCHVLFQFYVHDNKLSCQLYQRSADWFLGVPFNIASYALLTMMVAQVTNLSLGEFIHTVGDAHIYTNHFEQVKTQLKRSPRPLPKMHINPNVTDLFAFTFKDFTLIDYDPHPAIKGVVSV